MSTTDFIVLSVEKLRATFEYNPDTGQFYNKFKRGRAEAGAIAGAKRKTGYIHLCVNSKIFLAHRAAIAITTGHWPTAHVDHINGDPSDNRISNLRQVTRSENMQQQHRATCINTSGYLGVSKSDGRWISQIKIPAGRRIQVHGFATAELAHEFYLLLKEILHPGYIPLDSVTAGR